MQFVKYCFIAALVGFAQFASAAGATKVAVLDIQAVVLLSEAGKKGMAEVEKHPKYTPIKAKLDNVEAELKTLDDKAKNESLTWGDDKKKEHFEKMSQLTKEKQEHIQVLSGMQESAFMQMFKALEPRIGKALQEIMANEGIELVLDSKTAILKSPSADITAMVTARLDKINAEAVAEAQKSTDKKPAAGKK